MRDVMNKVGFDLADEHFYVAALIFLEDKAQTSEAIQP